MTRTTLTKITAVLVALLIMIPFAAFSTSAAITPTADWGDTNGDGVLEVTSAADFLAIPGQRTANGNYVGKTIKLMADIDLNPGWDASSGTKPENVWTSMWSFGGNIDGNGHTVSGLYIEGAANTGFARETTGDIEIKDIAFVNSVVKVNGANSSFIGNVGGSIKFTNVYMEAAVSNGSSYAGGFVANVKANKTATFENCVFNGSVSATAGDTHANGFVGNAQDGAILTFTNCAVFGTISASAARACGFVTAGGATATFTNCLAAATCTAPEGNAAGFAAFLSDTPTVAFADSYMVSGVAPVSRINTEAAAPSIAITYAGAAAADIAEKAAAELDMAGYTDTCKDIYVPTSIATLLSINHVDNDGDNKCDNAGCDYTYPTVTPDDTTAATPDDTTAATPDDTTASTPDDTTTSSPTTGDTSYLYLLVAVIAVVGCVAVVSKSKKN